MEKKYSKPLDEKTLERYLCKKIKTLGGMCIKLLPFACKGLPDRLVVLPGGRVMFVELKTEKGRVSNAQKVMHIRLKKLGAGVYILKGKEEIDKFIESWS